jgi:hypothetical protein
MTHSMVIAAKTKVANMAKTTTTTTTTIRRILGNYSTYLQHYFDPWRAPQHVRDHDMQCVPQRDREM